MCTTFVSPFFKTKHVAGPLWKTGCPSLEPTWSQMYYNWFYI